jgi:hypothetical protein
MFLVFPMLYARRIKLVVLRHQRIAIRIRLSAGSRPISTPTLKAIVYLTAVTT